MALKPKVSKPKITLFKCKTCKGRYNNRLTHVCKIKFSRAGQRRVQG